MPSLQDTFNELSGIAKKKKLSSLEEHLLAIDYLNDWLDEEDYKGVGLILLAHTEGYSDILKLIGLTGTILRRLDRRLENSYSSEAAADTISLLKATIILNLAVAEFLKFKADNAPTLIRDIGAVTEAMKADSINVVQQLEKKYPY
jgi:hypothetical protein